MCSRGAAWRFLNYPAHAFHVDLFSPSCCRTRASHGTTSPLSFPLCRSLSESRSSSCVRSSDEVSLRSSGSNAQIRLRTVCEPFRDTALTIDLAWSSSTTAHGSAARGRYYRLEKYDLLVLRLSNAALCLMVAWRKNAVPYSLASSPKTSTASRMEVSIRAIAGPQTMQSSNFYTVTASTYHSVHSRKSSEPVYGRASRSPKLLIK